MFAAALVRMYEYVATVELCHSWSRGQMMDLKEAKCRDKKPWR
jgi:hypothetical protein